MNNSEIAAAFAAMVRGDRKAARIDGRNNLSVKAYSNGQIAVYSYYTPIAVYDGTKVVINQTFLSASTAKHQSKLNGLRYGCPVAVVLHFGCLSYGETDLLKQAAPLYSYTNYESYWLNVEVTDYTRGLIQAATMEDPSVNASNTNEIKNAIAQFDETAEIYARLCQAADDMNETSYLLRAFMEKVYISGVAQ